MGNRRTSDTNNNRATMTPEEIRQSLAALDENDIFSVALLFTEYGFSEHEKRTLTASQLRRELRRINGFIDNLPGKAEDKERIKPAMFQFIKDHGPPIWKEAAIRDRFFDIVDMVIHAKGAA